MGTSPGLPCRHHQTALLPDNPLHAVRSARSALPALPLVGFSEPPPEPAVPITRQRALRKSSQVLNGPHAVLGHGVGIRAPR
jgi:hypothetical protein